MNDTFKYLRKILQDYDSSLDLRDGSALSDLLLKPSAAIVNDLKNRQDVLFRYLTLQDPETLEEDVLDSFASSFLVNRNVGNKAYGYVRLYYTSPKTVSIPFGTVFENALGKQYKTTSSYTFTQQDLQNNTDVASYYSTGDVYVEAVARGTDYESSAGTVTKLITKLSQTPAFVNNVLPITGSTVHENNSSLYTKIINSAVNRTVYASQGIEALLMEQYPTIENVEVVGKTHEKMLRDLSYVYSASGITYNLLFERSDYFGSFGPVSSGYIYSGLLSGPFYHFAPFNECVAYSNGVTYSGTITSGTLPSTAQFVNNEFNLEQYAGLYKNDSNYAVVETSIILNENFDNPGLKDRGWTISDSSAGLNNLRYYKEVDITGGKLRLGYNSASGIQPVSVIVTPDLLSMISGLIDRAVAL